MAQFSIKEAVIFSFASCGKHFVLLFTASALLGASVWFATVAPRYVSQKLGIEHHLIHQDINAVGISYDEAKADPSTITQYRACGMQCRAEEMISSIFARPQESIVLIVVTFFVWAWFLILLLGCMNLGLSLVDKNAGSLIDFFAPSARQIMRFLLSCIFYFWYTVAAFKAFFFMRRIIEAILKKYLSAEVFLPCMYLLLSGVIIILIHGLTAYVFYGYCIVDDSKLGGWSALKLSTKITKGSLSRIIVALLIFALFAGVVGYLINMLVILSGVVGVMGEKQEVTRFACTLLTTPFSIPYFSYIYRSLTRKA